MSDAIERVLEAFNAPAAGTIDPAGYEDGMVHACPCCGVMHSNHGCINGKVHGAVVTRSDDPETYSELILGPTPNDHQYGYCEDCKVAFRWDVERQGWFVWTDEERQMWRAEYRHQQEARQQRIEEALA